MRERYIHRASLLGDLHPGLKKKMVWIEWTLEEVAAADDGEEEEEGGGGSSAQLKKSTSRLPSIT